MRSGLRIFGLLAIFLLSVGLDGQLVCIDTGNGRPTEVACSCEGEKISPNLMVAKSVKVTGSIFDQTGAPIQYNRTTIEVRDPLKNKTLSSAVLDQRGGFDLGVVPEGIFRLVVFRMEGEKASRLPLFDQSKPVSCSGESECKLKIVLVMHGTDQQFEFCPPR